MKWIKVLLYVLLLFYSVALIRIDVLQGQEYVRGYFSDIVTLEDYPLPYDPLFGINTSLSVVLLCGTALLFAVCLGCGGERLDWKFKLFYSAQILLFLYLALDDRLRFHEYLGVRFGVQDAFILFGLGLAEGALLLGLGRLLKQPWRLKGSLIAVCGFFCVMIFVDAFLPSELPGRLAVEDLCKLWAGVFLLSYAWDYCMDWIAGKPWCCLIASAE